MSPTTSSKRCQNESVGQTAARVATHNLGVGNMRAERLADYVKRTIATMPPLTYEQVDKLAMLLGGSDAA